MNFGPVSAQELHAAQILTGAAMAAWLLSGFVPRHGGRLQAAVVVLYLASAATLILYVALR